MRQVTRTPGKTSWVSARMPLNGQVGSISSGNRLCSTRAVDVLDLDRGAADAFQRMQDDEAGAVGDEVAERLALGRERQLARSVGLDAAPGRRMPAARRWHTAS